MYEALHLLAILPFPNIDPVAFSIGPLKIHWYGLAYVAGILLGWFYACKLVDSDRLWPGDKAPLTRVHLDDFLVWITAGIVLGGRLGYVFFYDFAKYMADPVTIIQIWDGGMAFHGGLIGSTIAMFIFARKNAIPVWSMFDTIAAVAPVGIFFGRIANFINGELWGKPSNAAWAVIFPTGGPDPRHPSQLYEAALEGILLTIILAILIYGLKALRKPGLVTGVFVAGYAVSRIIVEFFREPDRQVGYQYGTDWITRGMVLSVPMAALGLWAAARAIAAARKARA